jgi:aspartyl-tRNA(Asn)/glutamyl-tRNA(Gln) amidotransferase subunit A
MAHHGALVTAEAYWLHRQRFAVSAADIDPRVLTRTLLGEQISLCDYLEIIDARRRLIAEVNARVGNRLVAFPTVPHVAPVIGALRTDDDLFVKINGKTLRNTSLGNFLDWCGLSIPSGTGEAGMPVGFLLSATAGADDALLSFGMAAEAVIRGDIG